MGRIFSQNSRQGFKSFLMILLGGGILEK